MNENRVCNNLRCVIPILSVPPEEGMGGGSFQNSCDMGQYH